MSLNLAPLPGVPLLYPPLGDPNLCPPCAGKPDCQEHVQVRGQPGSSVAGTCDGVGMHPLAHMHANLPPSVPLIGSYMIGSSLQCVVTTCEVLSLLVVCVWGPGPQADQEERQVVVQRKTYCRVCGKWLGDSILVILPDNTPIHKYCYRAKLDM